MNEGDKRVQRTKNEIENALLRLIEEYGYQKLTVKQLINESGYSRTAFYSHYRDKDDCLKHCLNNQVAVYVSNFRQIFIQSMQNHEHISDQVLFYKYYHHIFDHIYNRKMFYKLLFCNESFIGFKNYFFNLLLQEISKNITVKDYDIDKELYVYSATFCLLGCIEYWSKEDFKFTSDYITKQYYQLKRMNVGSVFLNDFLK